MQFDTVWSWDGEYQIPVSGAASRAAQDVRFGDRYAQFPISRRVPFDPLDAPVKTSKFTMMTIGLAPWFDRQRRRDARFTSRQDQDLYILFTYSVGRDAVKVAFSELFEDPI